LNAVLELRDSNKITLDLVLTLGYLATLLTSIFTTIGTTVNERIKELAKESGYVYHVGGTVPYFEFSNNQLEKFARLIVQECGQWIIDNAGAMEHLGPEYFAKEMIKDFGVE
jgi:hypothetical protein